MDKLKFVADGGSELRVMVSVFAWLFAEKDMKHIAVIFKNAQAVTPNGI